MNNNDETPQSTRPKQPSDSAWNQAIALLETLLELPIERRDDTLASSSVPTDVRVLVERLLTAHSRDTGPLERPPQSELSARYGSNALKGRRFGRWQLQHEIGQGGMAVVYRAVSREAPLGQEAAIKVLTLGAFASGGQERFLRERQLLARLQHPFIIPLYDAGITDDGTPWLAMALVDGERIDHWCDKQGLSVAQRIDLIQQVAEALKYAHHNLVIHRDIKPSNVLVDDNGHIRLLDFGIAKLNDELEPEQTATALRALTPEYAAPEQFAGAPPSTTMDVYGLGALLYRLLSGQSPRHRDSSGSDARTWSPSRVVQQDATRPQGERSQWARQLHGDLDTIVMKALAHEPERRYTSIEAMAEDLRRWRDREPIAAHPPSAWYRTRKFVARNRLGVSAAALVLIVVGVAFVATLWQARIAQYQAKRANAVRDFLVELLDASKAVLPYDQRPTPELLVQQAAKRLRDDPTVDISLRVDLLRTLGQVSMSVGDYGQAQSLLDEAARDAKKLGLTDSSEEWLDIVVQKSAVLVHEDRGIEAERLLAGILPELRASESKTAVVGLMLYADTRLASSGHRQAKAIAQEAVVKAKRVYPPDSPALMKAMVYPGLVSAMARPDESAALLEPAIAQWRASGLSKDVEYAGALLTLAEVKQQLGELAQAEALYRESIAVNRNVHQGPHNDTAEALGRLAYFLFLQERFEETHTVLEEALAMSRQTSADSTHVAKLLDSLTTLEIVRRQYGLAEKYGREALAIYVSHPEASKVSKRAIMARNRLAHALLEGGQLDQAQPLNEQALTMFRATVGEKSENTATALYLKSSVALARGDAAQALAISEHAAEILDKLKFPVARIQAANFLRQGQALVALRRYQDAIVAADAGLSKLAAQQGEANRTRVVKLLALRARSERALKRFDAADRTLREARALKVPADYLSAEDAITLGMAPASGRQ